MERVEKAVDTVTGANRILGSEAAAREKRWDECGIEEKVERLRVEAQDRRTFIEAGYGLARKAWQLVRRHQHAGDGRVLQDAEDAGNDSGGLLAGRFDRLR